MNHYPTMLERCIEVVRGGGRVAYPNGVEPKPKKRRGIEVTSYEGTAGVREFEHLGRALETSKVKISIAGEYRLADAAKAHQRIARGHLLGKIVLRIP